MNSITRFDRMAQNEMTLLKDRISDLFNRFIITDEDAILSRDWSPACDIAETPNSILLKAELPGVDEKDVHVEIGDRMLSIKGEKKFEKESTDKNYRKVERSYGLFTRSFTLPEYADTDHVNAEFKNGVLEVTVPKVEQAKKREVKVNVSGEKKLQA